MVQLHIYEITFKFAKRIIKLNRYLTDNRKEYVISNQILKSGTSIGANISEAKFSESNKDFIHKFKIALKEANETSYWLDLLKDDFINDKEYESLIKDLYEIRNKLIASIKKMKTGKDQTAEEQR